MVSPEEKLRPIVEARRRREERLANDSRTTDELLALARLEMQDDNSDKTWDAVAVLQYRATDEIFRLAQSFCESNHPTEQALGATLLGQNLVEQKDFPDEKFDILFHILETSQDSDVLSAACFALGHLRDERAIGPLLKLKDNPDNDVRFSVVHGLWTYEDEAAIGALIDLSKDADDDVRDWATFGLGSQIDSDTEGIRNALVDRLADSHEDTRAETILGLARRKDKRVVAPLKNELTSDSIAKWMLEAATELGDARLCPELQMLDENWAGERDQYRELLEEALSQCGCQDQEIIQGQKE